MYLRPHSLSQVQEAVASCVPPLCSVMKDMKDETPSLIKKLSDKVRFSVFVANEPMITNSFVYLVNLLSEVKRFTVLFWLFCRVSKESIHV